MLLHGILMKRSIYIAPLWTYTLQSKIPCTPCGRYVGLEQRRVQVPSPRTQTIGVTSHRTSLFSLQNLRKVHLYQIALMFYGNWYHKSIYHSGFPIGHKGSYLCLLQHQMQDSGNHNHQKADHELSVGRGCTP